ncbi:Podovirus DNA encapsidation protein (Gp16) [compost metagenome]
MIDGTEYGDMSLDNEFVNDSSLFIEKRSKTSRYQFSVIYKGMTIGIWVDVDRGIMFLANEHDPSSKNVYALTANDLNENSMLMTNWKQNYQLFKMVKAFQTGYLRFDNQVLRNVGYEMFKKMRIQ